MKKVAFFTIFLLLGCVCFARGQKESINFGVGLPYFIENQTVSGVDVKTEMESFAINLSGINLYNDTTGIGAYINIFFPSKFTLSAMGESATVDSSAYDFLQAMDMLIGPVFILYDSEKITVPLGAGLHIMQLLTTAGSISTSSYTFGLGANISGEYNVSEKVYFFVRLQLTLDFYSTGSAEQYVYYGGYSYKEKVNVSGALTTFGINPAIGIGFSW